MKLVTMQKLREVKTPYMNDVEHIHDWISPVSVIVKGIVEQTAGLMVSDTLIATTRMMTDKDVAIVLSTGEIVKGVQVDYVNENLLLSFYSVPKQMVWHKTPTRIESTTISSFLFAYVPHKKFLFSKLIPNRDSRTKEHLDETGSIQMDIDSIEDTSVVVDRFGYVYGIGVGSCFDELVVQPITLKQAT